MELERGLFKVLEHMLCKQETQTLSLASQMVPEYSQAQNQNFKKCKIEKNKV